MKDGLKLTLIVGGIIVLSIIDLGANVLSLIPGFGGLLETFTETILEMLQILLAAFGFLIIGGKRK